MEGEDFEELFSDGEAGVECGHGFLIDHGDLVSTNICEFLL